MNNKLEELSKKLDNEIKTKEANEKREAFIKSEATSAGIWGAIKLGIAYGIGGLIFGGIIGIWAGNTVATIIFFLGIIIGGAIGYSEEYENKRERLSR